MSRIPCDLPGCKRFADMLPVLIVERHALSVAPFEGVRSILGVAVCRPCYNKLTTREFLCKDEIRLSIEADFRRHGAIPDFNRARFDFCWHRSPEFAQYIAARDRARSGHAGELAHGTA